MYMAPAVVTRQFLTVIISTTLLMGTYITLMATTVIIMDL
jgi:hypothetical protein